MSVIVRSSFGIVLLSAFNSDKSKYSFNQASTLEFIPDFRLSSSQGGGVDCESLLATVVNEGLVGPWPENSAEAISSLLLLLLSCLGNPSWGIVYANELWFW